MYISLFFRVFAQACVLTQHLKITDRNSKENVQTIPEKLATIFYSDRRDIVPKKLEIVILGSH